MGGEWIFSFKHENKGSLDLPKYQQFLRKLRQEFESEFSIIDSTEGSVKWTNLNQQNIPVSNVFASFTYNCIKDHIIKGHGHGTWTLYWDPTEANTKNNIHARCAPMLFKDLSNQIQTKLANEFPDHFAVKWKNGLSGYEGYDTSRANQRHDNAEAENDLLRQMMIAMKWNDTDSRDSERCIHHIPWSYCSDCSEDLLEMHGY